MLNPKRLYKFNDFVKSDFGLCLKLICLSPKRSLIDKILNRYLAMFIRRSEQKNVQIVV